MRPPLGPHGDSCERHCRTVGADSSSTASSPTPAAIRSSTTHRVTSTCLARRCHADRRRFPGVRKEQTLHPLPRNNRNDRRADQSLQIRRRRARAPACTASRVIRASVPRHRNAPQREATAAAHQHRGRNLPCECLSMGLGGSKEAITFRSHPRISDQNLGGALLRKIAGPFCAGMTQKDLFLLLRLRSQLSVNHTSPSNAPQAPGPDQFPVIPRCCDPVITAATSR